MKTKNILRDSRLRLRDVLTGCQTYLGMEFINAHKVISLAEKPDEETREAWIRVFRFTLDNERATYTAAQRTCIEFALFSIRDRPINPSTIKDFVKNAVLTD